MMPLLLLLHQQQHQQQQQQQWKQEANYEIPSPALLLLMQYSTAFYSHTRWLTHSATSARETGREQATREARYIDGQGQGRSTRTFDPLALSPSSPLFPHTLLLRSLSRRVTGRERERAELLSAYGSLAHRHTQAASGRTSDRTRALASLCILVQTASAAAAAQTAAPLNLSPLLPHTLALPLLVCVCVCVCTSLTASLCSRLRPSFPIV